MQHASRRFRPKGKKKARNSERGLRTPSSQETHQRTASTAGIRPTTQLTTINTRPAVSKTTDCWWGDQAVANQKTRHTKKSARRHFAAASDRKERRKKKHAIQRARFFFLTPSSKNVSTASTAGVCERDLFNDRQMESGGSKSPTKPRDLPTIPCYSLCGNAWAVLVEPTVLLLP